MKRIEHKIREITDSLEIIQEGLPPQEEEFITAGLLKDGIYKRLEFCIQNISDILGIIYSAHRIGIPHNVDDIFQGLLRKEILPRKVILKAEEMKGLRNVLVHKYGEIDDARVYAFLTEQLDDFHFILDAFEHYLKKNKTPKSKKRHGPDSQR